MIKLQNNSSNNNLVEKWSDSQVSSWLATKKIDTRIVEILKKFNGSHLKRLQLMRKEAPDFFYQTISNGSKIDLFSLSLFIEEFEKLVL